MTVALKRAETTDIPTHSDYWIQIAWFAAAVLRLRTSTPIRIDQVRGSSEIPLTRYALTQGHERSPE